MSIALRLKKKLKKIVSFKTYTILFFLHKSAIKNIPSKSREKKLK